MRGIDQPDEHPEEFSQSLEHLRPRGLLVLGGDICRDIALYRRSPDISVPFASGSRSDRGDRITVRDGQSTADPAGAGGILSPAAARRHRPAEPATCMH